MRSPLVSVIIAAYNVEGYISKCIQSILDQKYQNIEILICDDKSTDNTLSIIKSFSFNKRVKYLENIENLGVSKTRNILLKLAKGDLIAIQDADDWSHPKRIYLQVAEFLKNPDLNACGTNFYKVNGDGNILSKSDFGFSSHQILESIPDQYLFAPNTLMFKRSILKKVGGYQEYFGNDGNEDLYFTSLIIFNGLYLNLRENLYFYRLNPKSITKSGVKTPRKYFIDNITALLLKDYKKKETNILEDKDFNALRILEKKYNAPYIENKELVFEKVVWQLVYWGLYKQAFIESYENIISNKFSLRSLLLPLKVMKSIIKRLFRNEK